MGRCILIYGRSGSGKSRSLKNFGEDEICLFNVLGKDLPFRKKFKYHYRVEAVDRLIEGLQKMPVKTAVIDDAGYIMTNRYMRGQSADRGNKFELFNEIGDSFWRLIMAIQKLPEDVNVYLLMHESSNDYGDVKLRTIGRLLDEKVCIEGMVTICLRCRTDGARHYFRTQSDGYDISKSPEEMFAPEIDNDLKLVDDTIRDYYR